MSEIERLSIKLREITLLIEGKRKALDSLCAQSIEIRLDLRDAINSDMDRYDK